MRSHGVYASKICGVMMIIASTMQRSAGHAIERKMIESMMLIKIIKACRK
nr:MAG TPA: hypothetical protein [Caudoviricetes sp.]